jgi:hypothetical protein
MIIKMMALRPGKFFCGYAVTTVLWKVLLPSGAGCKVS